MSRQPIPFFPEPPQEYDRAYMAQVVRAFSAYARQMMEPTQLRNYEDRASAASDGVLMWDAVNEQIVVSKDGLWVPLEYAGMTRIDAFGRLSVSNPATLFDSKQLHDNAPLFWDDQEVSGTGTTSVFSANRASTTIGVAATTAGKRVRQTFQRFNYQPGKSQECLLTAVLGSGGAGISAAIGLFDDENGFFVQSVDGVVSFGLRSNVTGTPTDTLVAQGSWSEDNLDGSGPSGVTLDPAKSQIFFFDFEWLGVGSVRMGFVVDGQIIIAHKFHNANVNASVYMSTPNLPVRYEIANDGTGAASTLEHICSTVISEGGEQELGIVRYFSTGRSSSVPIEADAAGTLYGICGIRLKSAEVDQTIRVLGVTMSNATADDYEWVLLFNPTVASGNFDWADETNSSVQVGRARAGDAVGPVMTGGVEIGGGLVKSGTIGGSISADIESALRLGSSISGTPDEIILCCRPLSINADIHGSIKWREAR